MPFGIAPYAYSRKSGIATARHDSPQMVREELIDRLVCSKYIFESSIETLERCAPYASGLAVLGFQDAVELVLRAIAEHTHAQLKENSAFNQILDEIDKTRPGKLTHRSALNQLNKARNNFKHLGLAPRDEDARKFRRDLEGFFPNAVNAFLDLDYSSLSLSSTIVHRRTRNWVKTAEESLNSGDYQKCLGACAIAVEIFEKNRELGNQDEYERRLRTFYHDSLEQAVASSRIFEEVQKQLDAIYHHLNLVGSGISYSEYKQFEDLTPPVMMTADGCPHLTLGSGPAKYEEALFCTGFARNLILRLQNQYRRNRFAPRPAERKFLTTKAAEIIAYQPRKDRAIEVIEAVDIGKELLAYGDQRYDSPEYIAIHYQGDRAYIESTSVVLIQPA